MIKHREQSYEEYFKEMEQAAYGDKDPKLNDYAVINLRIYMKWAVELYRTRFKTGKMTVFEPGCWMGETGVALAKLYSEDEVVFKGMEVSDRVLTASKKYHNYSFYGNICSCPEVPSESFNLIWSRTLLGFLQDVPAAVSEMIRLATTPGMVIIVQPMPTIQGFWHYTSIDSMKDLPTGKFPHRRLKSIPVFGPDGKSIFGEDILIVEKV
jgi:SAM-dependent methyltransferase